MNEAMFLQLYLSNQMKKEIGLFTITQKNEYYIVILEEDKRAWISLSLLQHNNIKSI